MKRRPGTHAAPPVEARHVLRLPGFILEESVGLGEVVSRLTSYAGMKPCGGCGRRAAALNRWVSFSRRR